MSTSESRHQTRLLGLRMTPDLFARLKAAADTRKVSPTSYARLLLSRGLGDMDNVPMVKSPRRGRPGKITESERQAALYLGEIAKVGNNLSQSVRAVKTGIKSGEMSEDLYADLKKELVRTHKLLRSIQAGTLEADDL